MRIFFILMLALFCACSPQHAQLTPQLKEKLVTDMTSGNLPATCQFDCYWSFLQNQREMKSLYLAGSWKPLAEKVTQVGHENEVSYFYLGRAAEELGYTTGAIAFYKHSVDLAQDGVSHHSCKDYEECLTVGHTAALTRLAALSRAAKQTPTEPVAQSSPALTSDSSLTEEAILNLSYMNKKRNRMITYVKGHWESGPMYLPGTNTPNDEAEIADMEKIALGDLNGDGIQDGAYVVRYGSPFAAGNSYAIHAVLWSKQGTVLSDPIFFGDRLRIISLDISKGRIICTYYTRGPGESYANTPTLKTQLTLALQQGRLVKVKTR